MISENKLKHMLGVARKCKQLAIEKNLSNAEQNACFIMGLLHDIGYELNGEITNHPELSYQMIVDALPYLNEILPAIRHHGRKYEDLDVFDSILNEADLTVDYKGEFVTIKERLLGVCEKHGEDSRHYKHAMLQAQALKGE
jgi:HD superfamily phosphohydrolase YqeK